MIDDDTSIGGYMLCGDPDDIFVETPALKEPFVKESPWLDKTIKAINKEMDKACSKRTTKLIPLSVDDVATLLADPKVVGRKIQFFSSGHYLKRTLEIRGVVDEVVLVGRWYDRSDRCWRYTTEDQCSLEVFAEQDKLFEVKR